MDFGDKDIALFRLLQEDLPLSSRPFADIAESIGLTETEVIEKIKEYRKNGIIRRFGSAVRHRELGYLANAMVVWNVPDNLTEMAGRKMASFSEVSHCYQRPRFPGWSYNMYTMVHGQTREECGAVASQISAAINISDYDLLFSTKELKKTSMKYFMD